jgi:hypothetical protein
MESEKLFQPHHEIGLIKKIPMPNIKKKQVKMIEIEKVLSVKKISSKFIDFCLLPNLILREGRLKPEICIFACFIYKIFVNLSIMFDFHAFNKSLLH